MKYAIVDLYSDEPAGLGVPPYLGTYPRYIAGRIIELDKDAQIFYLTIDDIRFYYRYNCKEGNSKKTHIDTYNLTTNCMKVDTILKESDEVIVIGGAHTPGKYLSAVPGRISEIKKMLPKVKRLVLSGPMASSFGSSFTGGRAVSNVDNDNYFDLIDENYLEHMDFGNLKTSAIKGAEIVKQIPYKVVAEIETSRGCPRQPGCSFCTEPFKWKNEFRDQEDIIKEIKNLMKLGVEYIRLGKQSCFYSYKHGKPEEIKKLLKPIAELKPKVLHIDNANPAKVVGEKGEEITKLIVKYCTEGNVAAFGVESFDEVVVKANNLNSSPETSLKAIRIINKYGRERGKNGMPKFLPGVNILLGLKGETKKTLDINLQTFKKILDEGLLLRRINIRQVVLFEGTKLTKNTGYKYIKKNKKYYFSFRKKVREQIDHEMLKRIVPINTILRDVYTQVHDGNTTFGRQFGTYPLIIGIKKKLPLKKFIDVKVSGYMLRSVIGELYEN